MKRILFDHQIFRKQPYGGISKYFSELITGIKAGGGYKVLPKKFYSANENLAKSNLTRLNRFRGIKNFPGKQNFEKVILKQEELAALDVLENGRFDIFHPTYYDPYFLKHLPANKPLVLTVHDMIHENYYDDWYEHITQETLWKRKLVQRADHIIAVSEYTKSQVLKYFPAVDDKKVSVIYHGANTHQPANHIHPELPERYILYVGIRKHYKNFPWLAAAIAGYLVKNNITLVCAGGGHIDPYEKELLHKLGLEKHVKYIAINSDDSIAALYSNALCFVFPSIEEGFGIPILEAFVNNCPVVLSNSSCFPEIAGDAALYFEQGNKKELVEMIDMVINQHGVANSLRNKGRERARLFTWETTVAKHLEIYNTLLH